MKVLGLMSGTSADGIDAAIVDIIGPAHYVRVKLLGAHTTPYTARVRNRILKAAKSGTVSEICHLNVLIGELFAQAALDVIRRTRPVPADIHLIGSHGQTVYHRPEPIREHGLGPLRSTLQIGEPAIMAERTGITTVANFRARDLAAGGEGAPLTPYVHSLLFSNPHRSRLIVNLGGIVNVTFLPAGKGLDAVRAFDIGPCNMLLDALALSLSVGRHRMDHGGNLARKGTVDPKLLTVLMNHPFLKKKPPKSTGREEFGQPYISQVLRAAHQRPLLQQEDLLATCCLFIAINTANATRWLNHRIDEVIIGGGGEHNTALMAYLGAAFEPTPIRRMEQVGWDSKSFEAAAFAILAHQTVHGICANVPMATGAHHPVILGTIVPGKHVAKARPQWRKAKSNRTPRKK